MKHELINREPSIRAIQPDTKETNRERLMMLVA